MSGASTNHLQICQQDKEAMSLVENWINETTRRSWFLTETGRAP